MSRSSGNGLTSYPLNKIPIDLWDKFGEKCTALGTNRRWAILMLISKFCGGTLHLENPPAPKMPRIRKRRRKTILIGDPQPDPVPKVKTPKPQAPTDDVVDLGQSF